MKQAVVTLEFGENQRRDLGLPLNIRTQILADALARALRQPEGEAYALFLQAPDGLRRLPSHASLGEIGVLCGMSLSLKTDQDMQSAGGHQFAYLKTDTGEILPLNAQAMIVGRSDPKQGVFVELDLSPFDLRKYISRRHASVVCAQDQVLVQDEGSTNGTFVNGQRLTVRQPQLLQDGDVIEFGKAEKGGVRVKFHAAQM